MAKHRPRPGSANGIGWLSGLFAGGRRAEVLATGRLPIEIVQNSTLQCHRLVIGKSEAMFDAELRRPAPQIAGVSKSWRRQRRKRRGRQWRDEKGILTGDDGGILPIEVQTGGLHAHDAKVNSV